MRKTAWLVPAMALLLGACAQVDEQTGTTFEQRCANYRATMATLDAAGRTDSDAYAIAKAFVEGNCPIPGGPAPAEPAAE